MALLGPAGIELVSQDINFDCTAPSGTLLCAQIRFLALQAGTYTVLASGSGGTGRYSMTLSAPACTPTVLNNLPPDRPHLCPGSPLGCTGSLDGNTTHTPCAAPLPVPGDTNDVPEPGSPARLYSFSANVGDVISLRMDSADAPHLFVLGPAPANPLVAANNSGVSAQLATALVKPGTYTIVVANDNALLSDDDPIDYTLFAQKCPVRAGLNPLTGRQVSGAYSTLDCLGTDDVPYRTYGFSGAAGQFVTTTMASSDVDSFVRVFAPDGSHVGNDDDRFQFVTSDARVSRILPVDGTYIVEVSASPVGPPVDIEAIPGPAFTVRARTCLTAVAAPGQIVGSWQDADCDLAAGRRGDVYTLPAGTTPAVVTIVPPSNGCVVALLGDGTPMPTDECSTTAIDVPVLGSAPQGFIIAGTETSTRGGYTIGTSRCAVTAVGFGATVNGALSATDCADPSGARADWFLLQAPADVVNFNFGMLGEISAGFPLAGLLSDKSGGFPVTRDFSQDPSMMFAAGTDLAAVLRVSGATAADLGAYRLVVDMASFRQ
jgi:hypothetical protein